MRHVSFVGSFTIIERQGRFTAKEVSTTLLRHRTRANSWHWNLAKALRNGILCFRFLFWLFEDLINVMITCFRQQIKRAKCSFNPIAGQYLVCGGGAGGGGRCNLLPRVYSIATVLSNIGYNEKNVKFRGKGCCWFRIWAATWKTNKMSVRPAKTQISLGIRPVWSESLLCAQWVAKDPSFLHADSEDSDQTGRMFRLIWVFAGRTVICFRFCHVAAHIVIWTGTVICFRFCHVAAHIVIWTSNIPASTR